MPSTCSRPSVAVLLLLAACGGSEPEGDASPEVLEARKILAEAGFPDGKDFPELELVYNTDEYHKSIASHVQETWRTKLGIHVRLRNMEFPVFIGLVSRGEFDIARRGWIGEYSDPLAFLELFLKDAGTNPTGWSSEEYERLIAESHEAADPAKRKELLERAETLLVEEAPMFPIFHYVAHNIIKPFVKGVYPNERDIHPLQGVTLEGEGAPKDGVLIFNGGAEPRSLDPAKSMDIAGLKILMHLYEGLVMPEPRNAAPVAAAAESWTVSEDGKTWTFRLREAQWSNGDPVTAHDFVYAWRRVVNPATASRYAHRMSVVENAMAIVRGEKEPGTLGVRAVDDRTLEVRLVRRTPYFLQLLLLNIYFPVHRKTVETHGDRFPEPGNVVTNGPYRFVEWSLKKRKVFEKNPRFRAADEVRLEKFVFLAVEDAQTAFTMYESGQCHWLFRIPLIYSDLPRPDHWKNPYNGTYFYVFNTRRKPLDDVRVRRALSLVIDRKQITTHILTGGEQPATRFVPPTSRLR